MCLSLVIAEGKIGWKEVSIYGICLPVLIFSEISGNNVDKKKITG